jgi:serine/threonine protein kinase
MPASKNDKASADLPSELHSLCDAFEQAWQQGRRPSIEEHLASARESLRPTLAVELLRLELELRCRAGEQPVVEEYASRFPTLAAALPGWLNEAQGAAHAAGRPTDGQSSHSINMHFGMPVSPVSTGPHLLGEYEIGEKLGGGGMGVVYRARHRRLDRLVALKLLPVDAMRSEPAVARFLREMRAIGSLKHPNVVEAHDAGERDGVVYLAMELLDGEDLAQLVKRSGPLPVPEACELARQAALGLYYLHERGLVHRDVKPSNLMRTSEGVVKVLDLGLARLRQEDDSGLTGAGACMGTPDFMAPEQGRDAAAADGRVDLYGLGATLFYLLAGKAPFGHHKGLHDKLGAHRSESPPDVRKLRPEVPKALADLVGRLLAKDPSDRPQTAAEVAAALAAFIEKANLSRSPAPQPPPGGKSPTVSIVAPRQPAGKVGTWLGVAGGLLVLGLGAWGLWALLHSGAVPNSADPTQAALVPTITTPTAKPLTIDLLVHRLSGDEGNRRPLGELGETTYRVRFKERVEVDATLSEPAYAFLIAFNPTKQLADRQQLFLPEESDKPSKLLTRVLKLDDGEGLQALAVVASRRPLPAFEEWEKRHPLGWQARKATLGMVWRASKGHLLPFFDEDSVRAKDEGASTKEVIGTLDKRLREMPGVEAVEVIGFAVERVD